MNYLTIKLKPQQIINSYITIILSVVFFHLNIIAQDFPFITSPESDQANNIRLYLTQKAEEISNSSLNAVNSLSEWEKIKDKRYRELVESLGLVNVPLNGKRPPLNVTITGEIKQDGFKIIKLYYESLPSLYVPGNLYVPNGIKKPRPAILYLCGHSSMQKVAYQEYARKFAQLGFVCLIIETIQYGEIRGEHHGCYARGWFNWYSRGYTPAGVEVWNALRGLDLLSKRKEVDINNLGVTGRSGGGAQTWFVAAVDKRVKAACPGVGATTVNEQILTRTIDDHCDCMMPINAHGRDFSDIGALIAPRYLLIDQNDRDRHNTAEGTRQIYFKIKKIYKFYNEPEKIQYIETHGGHGSTTQSRQYMFSYFLDKLMDKDVPPEDIEDINFKDKANLSADELRVYINGAPEDDRTKSIQNSFIPLAETPDINNETELMEYRDSVIQYLRANTFSAFPKDKTSFVPHIVFRSMDTMDKVGFGNTIYSFVSEIGWRLRLDIRWKLDPTQKKPLLIVLKDVGDNYDEASEFIAQMNPEWNVAFLNVRGVDQCGWEEGLQWHARRASAWTGRTIASMQVYDLLRAIEFCRQLENVDPNRISIATRDEMGVVALYSALLDGNIHHLYLKNPPSTQDQASRPDGTGPAIEMLNCLRVTDVNRIPALILNTDITFIGEIPASYQWSENVRKKINGKGFKYLAVDK